VGAQKEKKLWFKANPATEGTPDQKRIFWFRAKEYGWGWYPATWEGWLVLLVFIALWILNYLRLAPLDSMEKMLYEYLPQTFVLVAVLIFVAYRTGEKPRWRWGKDKNKK
jgi:hypothetical protein